MLVAAAMTPHKSNPDRRDLGRGPSAYSAAPTAATTAATLSPATISGPCS